MSGVKPKKSLGQNFLRDKNILEKIIESAQLSADDFVIEIGPGEGVLTEKLAEKAKKVVAIEIDQQLIPNLERKFKDKRNVEIINEDVLKANLPELIKSLEPSPVRKTGHPLPKGEEDTVENNYKVIANIPYYITSAIIRLFLETKYPPQEMILMIQKEVAQRIVAKPGEMSLLAVSVQYYAYPQLLFYVDKSSFYPQPEVDSAVIRLICANQDIPKEETKKFFRVVRAGFSSKRKTLLNNLSTSFHQDKRVIEEIMRKAEINPSARAQELNLEDWKKLVKFM